MKTMKNWLLTGLMFLVVSTVFSQGKVTGTITDGQVSLPGANVAIKGSATGVTTDFDGKFSINAPVASGELVISFIGYEVKTVKFSVSNGATANVGTIVLSENSNELNEIVVTSGVVDIAKDRKTPVAVSTIRAAEIQEKLGTQEFPEILKNTPSVYVTKSGGGFGDARINIRGFDQKNIAVMINGVPINDMENSSVFWSNWAGLSDVTSAMQVQRGLGSSKLAISSVGGTINILTKSSDMKEGGSFSSGFGNADYLKVQGSYNTGLMKNGFSASVLLSSTTGNGYVDGTKFEAKNYYIAVGYKANNHDIQFTFTGAPQWHNQRSTFISLDTYLKYGSNGKPNTRYNSDWGTLNGEQFNMKRNFYHKPVGSINWDWKINETTKLSTVVYGSWGRGGGSGGVGGIRGLNYLNDALRTNGLVDFNKIQAWNSGQPVMINGVLRTRTMTGTTGQFQNSTDTGSNKVGAATVINNTSGISRVSSFNSHDWYGGIVSLNKKLTQTFTLDFGLDARTYVGYHFQNLNSVLGGNVFVDNTNKNFPSPGRVLTETYSVSPSLNPFASSSVNEKLGFDSEGNVNWLGAFTQLEYSRDNLTAFVQGAVSQQAFRRVDNFLYPEFIQNTTTPNPDYNLRKTSYKNIVGGNVKTGANYNINEQNNVFVNAGYYSKQPFFNAVYPNNKSIVAGNLVNEKITGFEAGYGFRSKMVNVNLNVYNTKWKDRNQRSNDGGADNPGGYYDFSGITEIHSGVELEANAKVIDKFRVNAMFSVGDWKYKGNSISNRYDASNNPVAGGTATVLYLDKVKVGDAAQLTASLGASYEVVTRVTLDANYNYNDKLYASISPGNFASATNKGSLLLPSYGLMDAGFSYKMLVGKNKDNSVNFRLNVNNVLDETYIAESKSNIFADDIKTAAVGTTPAVTYQQAGALYNGVATANNVYFGFGRTWNFTMRYNF
jgi:hypothetical protein